MEITFSLPHVFSPNSPLEENGDALEILLECMVQLNQAYLRDHATPALYSSGVRYGRTILWEPIPAVLERGYGDCKSLAPWLVAELRAQKIPSKCVFRFVHRDDGNLDFHILVQRTDTGEYLDPSRELGMGSNETADLGDEPLRTIVVDALPRKRGWLW
jgi:hypothetical protein